MAIFILSIETSTVPFSVAVSKDDQILSYVSNVERTTLASQLTIMIQRCCKEASVKLSQLNGVALAPGPGSYTGLRIGMSVAKGLCFALNIPLLLVSGFKAIANEVITNHPEVLDENTLICPALDARRNEVYLEIFDIELQELLPATACILPSSAASLTNRDVSRIICVGDGGHKLTDNMEVEKYISLPLMSDARWLAPLAYARFQAKAFDSVSDSEPFYLKPPNITTPKISNR